MTDVRDEILRSVSGQTVTAAILAEENGILSGTESAGKAAEQLGLNLLHLMADGDGVKAGDEIARFRGGPKQVVMAEEVLMGMMAKPSGIATMAGRFRHVSAGRPRVVCGAWKKMPPSLKQPIRNAVAHGGIAFRICDEPFAYLDKNYVRILGGVGQTLDAVCGLGGHVKVIQIKGDQGDIVSESLDAVRRGAGIVFVDSGLKEDVRRVSQRLRESGLRSEVQIAFAGGIALDDMVELKTLDIDIVDVGRSIVDAPLLDMRMEVRNIER